MTPDCTHCDDTGSLSKDIEGQMDCVYCTIAGERAGLEIWALRHGLRAGIADLWLIYRHGRDRGLDEAAEICDDRHYNWRFGDGDDSVSGPKECAALIRAKRGGN
jgi:hypothetical protein